MNKRRGGFSYVEILVALGLFAIMLVAVLPMLLQAGRNMRFAETHYKDHLLAHAIMLDVRDDLLDGMPPQLAALNASTHTANRDAALYFIRIYDASKNGFDNPGNVPGVQLSLDGETLPVAADGYIIIVSIWSILDERYIITGRAIGAANPLWEGEYEGT